MDKSDFVGSVVDMSRFGSGNTNIYELVNGFDRIPKRVVKDAIEKTIKKCYKKLEDEGWYAEDSIPTPEMIQEELLKELSL